MTKLPLSCSDYRVCFVNHPTVKNLDQYYAMTPMFDFWVPENNAPGVAGPADGISMSHGVWLMLAPLSVGTHVIHFGGGDASFQLDIAYILTVK